MVLVSGYLIRQVAAAGDKDDFVNKHMSGMKRAVETGNYRDFIETLYWEITPDGQLLRESETYGDTYAYNCYQEGWSGGYFYRGCSALPGDATGLAGCLSVSISEGRPDIISSGTYAVLNYANVAGGQPYNSLNMYVDDYESLTGVSHPLIVKNSIPILTTADRITYTSLVASYVQSHSDSDYQAIELLLKSSLYMYGLPT